MIPACSEHEGAAAGAAAAAAAEGSAVCCLCGHVPAGRRLGKPLISIRGQECACTKMLMSRLGS